MPRIHYRRFCSIVYTLVSILIVLSSCLGEQHLHAPSSTITFTPIQNTSISTPLLSQSRSAADGHSTITTLPTASSQHIAQVFSGSLFCENGCQTGDLLRVEPGLGFTPAVLFSVTGFYLTVYNMTTGEPVTEPIALACSLSTCPSQTVTWLHPVPPGSSLLLFGSIDFYAQSQVLGEFIRFQYIAFPSPYVPTPPQFLILPVERATSLGATIAVAQGLFSTVDQVSNVISPPIQSLHSATLTSTAEANPWLGSLDLQFDGLDKPTAAIRVLFVGNVVLSDQPGDHKCAANGAQIPNVFIDPNLKNILFIFSSSVPAGLSISIVCLGSIFRPFTNDPFPAWLTTFFFDSASNVGLSSVSSSITTVELTTKESKEILRFAPTSSFSQDIAMCSFVYFFEGHPDGLFPTYVSQDSFRVALSLTDTTEELSEAYVRIATQNSSQIIFHDDSLHTHQGIFPVRRLQLDHPDSQFSTLGVFFPIQRHLERSQHAVCSLTYTHMADDQTTITYHSSSKLRSFTSWASHVVLQVLPSSRIVSSSSHPLTISSPEWHWNAVSNMPHIHSLSHSPLGVQLSPDTRAEYAPASFFDNINNNNMSVPSIYSTLTSTMAVLSAAVTNVAATLSLSSSSSSSSSSLTTLTEDTTQNYPVRFTVIQTRQTMAYLLIFSLMSDYHFELTSSEASRDAFECLFDLADSNSTTNGKINTMNNLEFSFKDKPIPANSTFSIFCPQVRLRLNALANSDQALESKQIFQFIDDHELNPITVVLPAFNQVTPSPHHLKPIFIILIVGGAVLSILLVALVGFIFYKKRTKRRQTEEQNELLHDLHYDFVID